jgi:arginase family enzyme
VRRPDDDLRGAEAFLEHYSITERDTAEASMQDAARRALSQYCSLFSGVVDGLDLKYYPRRSTSSAGGVIVSQVGEGNPRLSSMVNLVAVLNTELDHALDELGKVRTEVAELRAECAARHYLDGGSAAPVGIQHPYRSPPRGRFDYGTLDCRTRIDLDP